MASESKKSLANSVVFATLGTEDSDAAARVVHALTSHQRLQHAQRFQ